MEEVLQVLRSLAKRVDLIAENVEGLRNLCLEGFKATGTSYSQMKTIIQKVVDEIKQTNEDIAEYGGVIEADSFV